MAYITEYMMQTLERIVTDGGSTQELPPRTIQALIDRGLITAQFYEKRKHVREHWVYRPTELGKSVIGRLYDKVK